MQTWANRMLLNPDSGTPHLLSTWINEQAHCSDLERKLNELMCKEEAARMDGWMDGDYVWGK